MLDILMLKGTSIPFSVGSSTIVPSQFPFSAGLICAFRLIPERQIPIMRKCLNFIAKLVY